MGGGQDEKRGVGKKLVKRVSGDFSRHLNIMLCAECTKPLRIGGGDVAVAGNHEPDTFTGESRDVPCLNKSVKSFLLDQTPECKNVRG